MAKAEDDTWAEFFVRQPAIDSEDAAAIGDGDRVVSFLLATASRRLLVKLRFRDGRTRTVELTPDQALYLREYLSEALKGLPGYGGPMPSR